MVGREGFEPSNPKGNRFTVCRRWPLDYLPMLICNKEIKFLDNIFLCSLKAITKKIISLLLRDFVLN